MIRFRSADPQIRIATVLDQHGDLSRQQLVDYTGIPRPRLSAIVQTMLENGALSISERVKARGRGRPTELLTLNTYVPQHVGFALQRNSSYISVTNTLFHPICEAALPTDNVNELTQSLPERLRQLWQLAQSRCRELGHPVIQPQTVGCAIVGLLPEPMLGKREATALDAAAELSELVTALTGKIPLICSTTPAAAIAESRKHANLHSYLYVRVSGGVAAALVSNDTLIRGAHNISGEIGHITAVPNGATCACGKHGCLETVISTPALCRKFGVPSLRLVAQAWQRDSGDAREILGHAAYLLGSAIANAAITIDPEEIVLAWPLLDLIPDLLASVRSGLRDNLLPALRDAVTISLAVMPEASAAAQGAAVWSGLVNAEAADHDFSDPR